MGLWTDLAGFGVLAVAMFMLLLLRLQGSDQTPTAYRSGLWLMAWLAGSLLLRVYEVV